MAAATGVPLQTLYRYEREGILPPPPRDPGGFRLYGPDHLVQVRLLERAKACGLTHAQIRELLRPRGSGTVDWGALKWAVALATR